MTLPRTRPIKNAFVFAFSVVVLLALSGGWQSAHAQLPGTIEVQKMDGFGRVIIKFKDRQLLPEYTSDFQNGILQIRFQEKIILDTDLITNRLFRYIKVVRPAFGEQGFTAALGEEVRVNVMDAGEKLFIDFLPASWKGPEPSLPPKVIKELANRAKEAIRKSRDLRQELNKKDKLPEIFVRFGRHPTFTRMVFDWNVPFDTELIREGDLLTLSFSQRALFDIGYVRANMPVGLKSIEQVSDENGLDLFLTTDEGVTTRSFREEGAFVIDFETPASPSEEAKEQENAPPAPQEAVSEVMPPPFDPPEQAAAAKQPYTPAPNEDAAPEDIALDAATRDEDIASDARAPASNMRTPDEEFLQEYAEIKPELTENLESSPRAFETGADSDAINVEVHERAGLVRVKIHLDQPLPTAVFQRNRGLWIVLETERKVVPLNAQGDFLFRHMRSGRAQALFFNMNAPFLVSVGNDGDNMIVTFGNMLVEPSTPLSMTRTTLEDGRRALNVDLGTIGNLYRFKDPIVGDEVWVVTTPKKAGTLASETRLVELKTLISSRGFAFLPLIDALDVRLENGYVIITSENGLVLSKNVKLIPELVAQIEQKQAYRPLNLAKLWYPNPLEYRREKIAFEKKLQAKPDDPREADLLEYARFFLANAMAHEAHGVLDLLLQEHPEIAGNVKVELLYGISNALMWRLRPALQTLDAEALKDNPDAAFWRMLTHARAQKWQEAKELLPLAETVFGTQTPFILNEALLAVAEAHIHTYDQKASEDALNNIEIALLTPEQQAHYDMILGKLYEARNDIDNALISYKAAQKFGRSHYGARAELEATRLKLLYNKIDRAQAIDALQSLSFRWRGDDVEMETFLDLSRLYAENGQYREAFHTMKEAIAVNPDAPETHTLQEEMRAVLVNIFDNDTQELNPISKLALFYDYRELIPVGHQGDTIVRNLARHLVKHELVDEASRILSHQIDNRLSGAARAQIASDLAVVQLRAKKPLKALNTLRDTEHAQLPDTLLRQRRLLEVRALSELDRHDTALDLLADLTGGDVKRLRADIYWQARRWRQAGEALEAIYQNRWEDASVLSDVERDDILRSAIAFVFANDEAGSLRLRTLFLPLMNKTSMAATFDSITQPVNRRGTLFREVMRNASSLETLNRFLDEYENRYQAGEDDPIENAAPITG